MGDQKHGWTRLQRQEGPDFLAWMQEHRTLQTNVDVLAKALRALLQRNSSTTEDALAIWHAVPAVMARCNEQKTYQMAGAPVAYAWLYLLERYVRTWLALERLVKENCLPMGKHGLRALDVGTGPGPSAFAIHDFYSAMVRFSESKGDPRWRQPAYLTCVEFDAGTNRLRHHLAEVLFEQSQRELGSWLAMCSALPDFKDILPTRARRERLRALRDEADEYYDEVRNEWNSELRFSLDEANVMAQSMHRYRLFAFSNFLTTPETVSCFESDLADLLCDARPGSVVLLLGGKGGPYPEVYGKLEQLSGPAGFQMKIEGEPVSSSDRKEVEDRIYEEGQWFYRFLMQHVPNENDATQGVVRAHFEGSRSPAHSSQVRIYRKYAFSGV